MTAKRSADGRPASKNCRTNGGLHMARQQHPRLPGIYEGFSNVPRPQPRQRWFGEKPENISPRNRMEGSNQIPTYDVVRELANAATNISFGQLLRGDGEPAKKELSRIFTKRRPSRRTLVTQISDPTQRRVRKVVSLKVYDAKAWSLLDSGAVSKIMSTDLMKSLALSPTKTSKGITVANGLNGPTYGSLKSLPV